VAAGAPEALSRLRAVLEEGPPSARVVEVEEEPWAPAIETEGFEIRR
jgi:acylphosphatase